MPGGPTVPGLPPDRICRQLCPGCCSGGGVCQSGTSATACGAEGAICVTCTNPTPICRNQACAACASGAECAAAGQGSLCCNGTCLNGVCCADADCAPGGNDCVGHQCRCGAGSVCTGGLDCCGPPGACTNTSTDPHNCGACGNTCPDSSPACWNGTCVCGDVCPSGACRWSSVQNAIVGTPAGGAIRLCPGVYYEDLFIGKTLTLIGAGDGADPAANTILMGTRTGSVVEVEAGATVMLRGLRVTNGSDSGIFNAGNLTLTGCTVTNNAGGNGGGIANTTGATLTLDASSVTINHARGNGGGIANHGTVQLVNGSTVTANYAVGDGGGIANAGAAACGCPSAVSGNMAGNVGADCRDAAGGAGCATCPACDVCANCCPFSSVQAAVDAARPGAIIHICAGTYTEDVAIDKDLALIGAGDGAGPAANTILRGTGSGRVVEISSWPTGHTVGLQGLRITGGGGVSYGGGVFVCGGTVTLFNCTIAGNSAYEGGGITNWGTLTLENCTITGNAAEDTGGGISNGGDTLYLVASSVTSNYAGWGGGGIYNLTTLNLLGSDVASNRADTAGGGLYNLGTLNLDNSVVRSNSAEYGAGITNWGTLVQLVNGSSVTRNHASNRGGGIENARTIACSDGSTVSDNTAPRHENCHDLTGSPGARGTGCDTCSD